MDDDRADLFGKLTPVQRRRLRSSIDIHDSSVERIAYQHTVFCQTCLPYRDPGDEVRLWEREQGRVSLLGIEGGPGQKPRNGKMDRAWSALRP